MNVEKEIAMLKGKKYAVMKGRGDEIYVSLSGDATSAVRGMPPDEFVLIDMFCAQNFGGERFTIFYVFEKRGSPQVTVFIQHVDGKAHSIAELFPAASWYEREIRDGFGLEFEGAFDERRLFLHETYPANFHPLLKSFRNRQMHAMKPTAEYEFRKVKGKGVYQIPVGPVHAGIIEPGHFRFSVIGETVFNLELRMFYKHRGIEKLAEGKPPEECVRIAESISGDETVANAVAFSNAVEKISCINVPKRAWHIRTILMEMERIYSHLGDMAGMVIDVAYPAGASPFFVLREEILRHNHALTGSRFMKGAVAIGGLSRDVSSEALAELSTFLAAAKDRVRQMTKDVLWSSTVSDRLITTGIVKRELINALNLTGPIARASGAPIDTRRDHPYGIYDKFVPSLKIYENGDVHSRFKVKAAEIQDSIDMIQNIIRNVPEGKVTARCNIKDGWALSMVEAPRGQSVHWVNIKRGRIDRYKIRTASFCNWQAMEHAIHGNIVPDFPLINKSMNLSYAGTDL
ncbi:MAG: NADH-quinone oxidoreductase subunit C [Candidatus Aenigmarchaeota archaeon]|nr:NADH-quinone oxidoreductase subunit C [Candidatus Aenigmarchaeota archaeon]